MVWMKKQIVVMHGGHGHITTKNILSYLQNKIVKPEDFKLKIGWKENIAHSLSNDFELFHPQMPNKQSAKYEEWKIWFEKLVPFLNDDVILVGHSLGGLFFIKYLSENSFSKKIAALFTVAAPYDGRNNKHLNETFALKEDLSGVTKQVKHIFMYHSKDDHVVPFQDFEKYQKKLPGIQGRVFTDRDHFNQEEFPELVKDIQSLK